ncbi:MAG: hypothetical protein IPH90_11890 [Thermomonas sp.]|nr:hypothetical protein [Thermomonas sp.]
MEIHRLDQASRRLLLLSARGEWDDAQRARGAAACCGRHRLECVLRRGDPFIRCPPRVSAALDAGAGSVPPAILERMQQVSRMVAVRSLQIEGAMLDFTSGCLEPLGVRHAFFKGASLAHRYHSAPAARPMCMHHTRHFWSHPHWYADLDAITAHRCSTWPEVRELAVGVRPGSTIEACLQLHEFARSADWPVTLSLGADRKRGVAWRAPSNAWRVARRARSSCVPPAYRLIARLPGSRRCRSEPCCLCSESGRRLVKQFRRIAIGIAAGCEPD